MATTKPTAPSELDAGLEKLAVEAYDEKNLSTPENIDKIVALLQKKEVGPEAIEVRGFRRLFAEIMDEMPADKKEEMKNKVKSLIHKVFEAHEADIAERKKKIDENIAGKEDAVKRAMAADPDFQGILKDIREDGKTKKTDKKVTDKLVRDTKKKELEERLGDDKSYRENLKMSKSLGKLLKTLEKPADYLEELRREEEKAKAVKKPDAAPAPEATEDAKDLAVLETDEFKSVDEILQAEAKWDMVVNDLHRKPESEDENLYWKSAKTEELEELTDEKTEKDKSKKNEKGKYWAFRKFMKKKAELETEALSLINPVKLDAKDKTHEALEEETSRKAKEILKSLLEGKPKNEELLLYLALGVKTKAKVFEKIQNILNLQIISSARAGKNIYEVVKNDKGEVQTVDLKDFLSKHAPFGEKMVSHSHEILLKLHKQFGGEFGDIAGFRDILIDIIKSRGGMSVGKVPAGKAKQIYTAFLLAKDANMGEKELCSLLIALKEHPPFVIDIVNTTDGWVPGSARKTHNILEDFCVDGAIYNELKTKLGMSGSAFNAFILKIAPQYERLRSFIKGKEDAKEEVKIEEINALSAELNFTKSDLNHFRKLMGVPLWPDKVGHAFKHALYLDDEGQRKIPLMEKRQGPDTVREINVVFVNVEEKIKRIAERLADERLDQELKEIGPQGWKQLWRVDRIAAKWWKRNASEGYRERYRDEYIKRLKTEPRFRTELMELDRSEVKPGWLGAKLSGKTPAEGTRENMNAEMDAIAERFGISWATGDTQSYLMEGEERNSMAANMENIAIQTAIRDLCRLYDKGAINDGEFQTRVKTQIIPQIQALQNPPDAAIISFLEETTGRGVADINKMGLLDRMRAHKAGLIALDIEKMKINIKLGKAQNVDVKTQVKSLNWTDRLSRSIVERAQKNSFLGRFISPTTTAIMGFGLVNIATQFATGRLGRYGTLATVGLLAPTVWPAVAGIAAGCLVGGAFSALRQNKETLRLKAMKERRAALGHAPEDDTKGLGPMWGPRFERRLEINGGLYTKVPAEVLQNNIDSAADYDRLRDNLATAIALNDLSELGVAPGEPERLDLISYPGEMSIEAGRLQMLKAIAKGRIKLRSLAAGRDANADIGTAAANERNRIIGQIRISDKAFNKFKRLENFKAAGVGALIGGTISSLGMFFTQEGTSTHNINLTPGGAVNPAALDAALAHAGLSPTAIADINSHLHFDPVTHALDQASKNYVWNTYHIHIDGILTPGGITHILVPLHGGAPMTQAQLISELRAHGLNTSRVAFDTNGHLQAASIADLTRQKANIHEIITPGGPGTSPAIPPSGWSRLASIHFNDNQPHAVRSHILDELRVNILGTTQPGPDGNYHFTVKNMFDPRLAHSRLPSGVTMPADASHLKVGLQLNVGGKNYWKFFTPDSSGEIKIPPEYIDATRFGPVARGGDTLPGLRTDAIAVGFDDSHGTYQVLASVKGQGGYTPGGRIDFAGDITKDNRLPDKTMFTADQDILEKIQFTAATPPLVGSKMQHLEYGKKEPPPPPYDDGGYGGEDYEEADEDKDEEKPDYEHGYEGGEEDEEKGRDGKKPRFPDV